jgi:hypothetical protein
MDFNDLNVLKHYGIAGMKWGVRRASTHSADHSTFAAIRKKRIRDMSDDELKTVTTRLKLVKKYDRMSIPRKKKVKELSNAELEAELRRGSLIKSLGTIKYKQIMKMSDSQVKRAVERAKLEKEYTSMATEDFRAAVALVDQLLK